MVFLNILTHKIVSIARLVLDQGKAYRRIADIDVIMGKRIVRWIVRRT